MTALESQLQRLVAARSELEQVEHRAAALRGEISALEVELAEGVSQASIRGFIEQREGLDRLTNALSAIAVRDVVEGLALRSNVRSCGEDDYAGEDDDDARDLVRNLPS